MSKWIRFLPVIFVLFLGAMVFVGLGDGVVEKDQRAVPNFQAKSLTQPNALIQKANLPQKVVLNAWGSWCATCRQEWPFLMKIATKTPLWGLNSHDRPQAALQFLQEQGNPFQQIIADPNGKLAERFGVQSAPETLLIENGHIRLRYRGKLTKKVWQDYFQPLLNSPKE